MHQETTVVQLNTKPFSAQYKDEILSPKFWADVTKAVVIGTAVTVAQITVKQAMDSKPKDRS